MSRQVVIPGPIKLELDEIKARLAKLEGQSATVRPPPPPPDPQASSGSTRKRDRK